MATSSAKSADQDSGAAAGARTDDITADIRQLREDIAKLAEDLRRTGTKSVSRARQAARDSAEEWQDDVSEAVREKPLTALALALGAGWLLGMIMRR
ncbi:DUF883 family protein [Chelativorans sp. Marseille-P2723]|uniref:DUF883 family protein n=1 Tax=Chelativorans sp. Marseille-P2723 TaxID=2709133 RepID=UPI00156D7D77|nr:DUF883 family protein [Chelativorans sp. Marseille-P2723]